MSMDCKNIKICEACGDNYCYTCRDKGDKADESCCQECADFIAKEYPEKESDL